MPKNLQQKSPVKPAKPLKPMSNPKLQRAVKNFNKATQRPDEDRRLSAK